MGSAGNVVAKPAFSIADYQTLVDGSRPATATPRPNVVPTVPKAKASGSTPGSSSGHLQLLIVNIYLLYSDH